MNTSRKIYVATALYLVGLILFETAQQYYYLNSFNLVKSGEVIYWDLLKSHATLWLVWAVFVIPLVLYIRKHPIRKLSVAQLLQYAWRIALLLLITLVNISLVKILIAGKSILVFWQYLYFFTIQKAALFVNAYLGVAIFINLNQSLQLLDAKVVELSDLSDRYESLSENYKQQKLSGQTPLIQIKIGNKVKNILLSDVIWVQSDDYCVKIHTKNKAYNLRKSMKAMEQELAPCGFIRIHRNSIVNTQEIDTLVFKHKPHVKLKNGQTIQIAASRIPSIKASLKIA